MLRRMLLMSSRVLQARTEIHISPDLKTAPDDAGSKSFFLPNVPTQEMGGRKTGKIPPTIALRLLSEWRFPCRAFSPWRKSMQFDFLHSWR